MRCTSPRRGAHILVVGGCLQPSAIHSSIGTSRQLSIHFVVGYDPDEFGAALRAIANCAVDVGALITATITLDEVPRALAHIASSDDHAKIIVTPTSEPTA